MVKLEDLQPTGALRGILPDSLVSIVNVKWFGSDALELTYKTPGGKVANELVYRHDEPRLELGRPMFIASVYFIWNRAGPARETPTLGLSPS
jgi:hypothetical protein